MTHHDVSLHRDGDDDPDGHVAARVAQHDDALTQPLALCLGVETGQVANPLPEQSDVQHQGVCHSQRSQEMVGGLTRHRLQRMHVRQDYL